MKKSWVLGLMAVVLSSSAYARESLKVSLFPTCAHLSQDRESWVVPVHAWVFRNPDPSKLRQALAAFLGRAMGLGKDNLDNPLFQRRALNFVVDNERGVKLLLFINGQSKVLKPSQPNGHVEDTIQIPRSAFSQYPSTADFSLEAKISIVDSAESAEGRIWFLSEEGTSVISDIDDTIKVTGVPNKHEITRNTFLLPFRSIPGMPERYRQWSDQGVFFHYVSASPWQLGPPLLDFFKEAGFPEGALYLKHFRWKDKTFFSLFEKPEHYKPIVIKPFLREYPKRKFILVGDSSEKDPEIYGALAREHPTQIKMIFILDPDYTDTTASRYAAAFQGISTDTWKVFPSASGMPKEIKQ